MVKIWAYFFKMNTAKKLMKALKLSLFKCERNPHANVVVKIWAYLLQKKYHEEAHGGIKTAQAFQFVFSSVIVYFKCLNMNKKPHANVVVKIWAYIFTGNDMKKLIKFKTAQSC